MMPPPMIPAPGGNPVAILLPPDLGIGQQAVRVSAWLAEVGEDVEQGDRIVELLMSGMTFDLAAPVAGRLLAIEKHLDAAVLPGDVLGWIAPESNDI
jgi:pyruvate/2-oxoglutarate dehydrogenase complex dihydrolipoamide acyltransferase (E2) component